MTRVVREVGPPRRMETCGAEEPYEGNPHVRFCGGIGRAIADPTRTADCLQPPLRCGAAACSAEPGHRIAAGTGSCLAFPPRHQRHIAWRVTPRTDQHTVDRAPAPRALAAA